MNYDHYLNIKPLIFFIVNQCSRMVFLRASKSSHGRNGVE